MVAKKTQEAKTVMDPESLIYSLRRRASLLEMAAVAVALASGLPPDNEAESGFALFAEPVGTKKPVARKKAKPAKKKVSLAKAKTKKRMRQVRSENSGEGMRIFRKVLYENLGRELTTRQFHDEMILEGWVSKSDNKINVVNVYLNKARKTGAVTRTEHGWVPVNQVETVAQDAVEGEVANA